MTHLWYLFKIITLCGLCVIAGLFFLLMTLIVIMVIKGIITRKKQD